MKTLPLTNEILYDIAKEITNKTKHIQFSCQGIAELFMSDVYNIMIKYLEKNDLFDNLLEKKAIKALLESSYPSLSELRARKYEE